MAAEENRFVILTLYLLFRSKRGFCEIKRGKILAKFGGCF